MVRSGQFRLENLKSTQENISIALNHSYKNYPKLEMLYPGQPALNWTPSHWCTALAKSNYLAEISPSDLCTKFQR